MEEQKMIDVLNSVIEINNDRIEGYETALNVIESTDDHDLKILFANFQYTSQECRLELVKEVDELGGVSTEDTKLSGKIHRIWIDFKAAVTGKDRVAILASCEYGDETAIELYEDVLVNHSEEITQKQQEILRKQYSLIKSEYEKIQDLKEMMAKKTKVNS
jgi:uncharacterized protein (TIGR02284 family)